MLPSDTERELTEHAETAYRRLIADWKATGPAKKKGRRRDTWARTFKAD